MISATGSFGDPRVDATVHGDEIRVGDLIVDGPDRERLGVVTSLRGYRDAQMLDLLGTGSQWAFLSDGSAMALPARQTFTVLRSAS